ncbi:putative glyoxalase [Neospora caninum Liverpool]|nr:putative glyoxalase [Neospora caninum Liverpool]CBZ52268.1 putative glyoxalase [Neospora caninum Liverpool]|eukprot:XP_003882300.1 putative glyoxalase [Neospora caninum Liverpool]
MTASWAERTPCLVRFASVRLRAKKTPQLAEDFYVRRMGMSILQPAVPQSICGAEGGALNRCRSGSLPRSAGLSRSGSSLGGSVCARSRDADETGLETVELKIPEAPKRDAGEKLERASACLEEEGRTPRLSPQESFRCGSSLKHAGSGRIGEEEERQWLFKKKRCACTVGYNYDRDVLLAGPPREETGDKEDDSHLACTFKSLHHEFLLEITSPDAAIPDNEIVPYEHKPSHTFSRIAFSAADVNAAQVALSSQMIRVGNAAQFTDVNFAVTFLDPENFRGRIIQHLSEYTFARKDGLSRSFHRRTLSNLGLEEVPPLGSRGMLHHVELRVQNIEASLKFYQQGLQLRLISKQAVPSFGLTFCFLTSDPNAIPPSQFDLDSHGNRAWLWDQKFSSICLKTSADASADVAPYVDLSPTECGFLGLTFLCKKVNEADLEQSLAAVGAKLEKTRDTVYDCLVYETRDPENIPIRILVCPDDLWTA